MASSHSRVPAANPWIDKALAARDAKRQQEAFDCFSAAIQLDPRCGFALLERAALFHFADQDDLALDDLNQALAAGYQTAECIHWKGMVQYSQGDFAAADESFAAAVHKDPAYADAWLWRGEVARKLRDDEAAVAHYTQAIKHNSNYLPLRFLRALAWERLGRMDEMLADVEASWPPRKLQNANSHNDRSRMWAKLRRFQEALYDSERAVEIDPEESDYREQRGKVLECLERYEEALEDCNWIIERATGDPSFHEQRARVLQALGRTAEAEADTKRASQIRHVIAGVDAYEKQSYGEAVEYFDRAIALDRRYGFARYWRGRARMGLREFEAAIDDFDMALECGVDEFPVLNERVDAYYYISLANPQADGRLAGLMADANRVLELTPKQTHLYKKIGFAHYGLGEGQAGVDVLTKAIEIEDDADDMAYCYFIRALCREMTGDLDGMIADFEAGYRCTPDLMFDMWLYERGRRWLKVGRNEEALRDYGLAIERMPNATRVLRTRANLLTQMGRDEEAAADLNRVERLIEEGIDE